MKLNELKYTKGSRRKEMRVGRGVGSKGKQCGRGMNGQTKHNGAGPHPGFEGGQLPLYRAIPKFGFTNFTRKEYAIVNVADLDAKFDNGAVIDTTKLVEAGLVKKTLNGVKVLGGEKITKSFTVRASKFSASAKNAIEEAGGTVEVID